MPPISPPIDDTQLVAAAQAGDREALDKLLRLHYDAIFAVCRRVTGNDADGADAAQNALIAIVRSLARFDGRSAFRSWAYRIATNASLDELRRRGRRGPVGLPDNVLDRTPSTDALIEGGLAERLAIDDALDRLPEEFRTPVVLRDLLDLDYAEIAEALQVPPGTVRSRISRGRAALAKMLGNPNVPSERPTGQP
jgi:RNA polymerase sigma-70 factor, ECF subfamily